MRKAIKDRINKVRTPPPPPPKPVKVRSIVARRPNGSKSCYSEIIAESICNKFAEGTPLHIICEEDGMPSQSTVLGWALNVDEDSRPGFAAKFSKAEEIHYHLEANKLIQIADDSGKDTITKFVNGKPIKVVDLEHIQRDKLRIDTRLKVLSKRLRRVFGEETKIEQNINIDISSRLSAARGRAELHESPLLPRNRLIEGKAESLD